MGDKELYDIKTEREEIYMKADFTNEDGIRAGILEDLFLKKNGWQAESDAAILLSGLGIDTSLHNLMMYELKETEKVKVLLARALLHEIDHLDGHMYTELVEGPIHDVTYEVEEEE